MMRWPDPRRLAWMVMGAAALAWTGCGNGLASSLDGYEQAVARALHAQPLPAYEPTSIALPRRRERRLDVSSDRIGIFDFLSLQGCRLGELAGFRNSPMGRVMEDTRRLVYELEVRAAAAACLDGLDEPRRGRLAELVAARRSELPRHLWNATFGGDELEAFLSPSPATALRTGSGLAALRRIRRLLEGGLDGADDARALEEALVSLTRAEPLGPLLRSLDRARHSLDAIAELVSEGGPGGDAQGCEVARVRLSRAFQQRYLTGVQPAVAELDRRALPLLSELEEIAREVRGDLRLPEPAGAYLDQVIGVSSPASLFARYRAAMARHSAALAPTLYACGVLPDPDEAQPVPAGPPEPAAANSRAPSA